MRLLSCHIENFGKLQNRTFTFEEGLNNILEENGWGKSTLTAFIRVMFYGFEGERKQGLSNERKRYAPWQGGSFGGSIRFEKDGKAYKVSRVFGNKEEGDEVSLIDEATGLETSDYDVANLGEELFGIDSDSFMRTAFISQNDCVYNETTENIDRKLGRLVEQTDDNAGYDSIVTRLKKAISAANSRVQKDSLHNLKRRATELEEEIKHKAVIDGSINEVRRLSGTTKEEMAGLEEKREGLLARRSICIAADEKRIRRARLLELKEAVLMRQNNLLKAEAKFSGRIPERSEIDETMQDARNLAVTRGTLEAYSLTYEEEDELQRLYDNYGEYSHFEFERLLFVRDPKPYSKMGAFGIYLAVFGVIALTAGVGFFVNKTQLFGALAGVMGLLCIVAGLIIEVIKKRREKIYLEDTARIRGDYESFKVLEAKKKKFDEADAKAARLNVNIESFFESIGMKCPEDVSDALVHIKELLGALAVCKEELSYAKGELNTYLEKYPDDEENAIEPGCETVAELDDKIKAVELDISETHKRLLDYSRRLETLKGQRDELEEKEDELSEIRDRVEKLSERVRLYNLTKDYLTKAKNSYTERYLGPIRNGFKKYYSRLTETEGEEYNLDANTHLFVEASGLNRDTGSLSFGYQNLVGLCMRLALFEAMYGHDGPFIVMDDPFVHMDEEKIKKGRELLKLIAGDVQVIYLTCHESRAM